MCASCGRSIPRHNYALHAAQCAKRAQRERAALASYTCELGCGAVLAVSPNEADGSRAADIAAHKAACPQRGVACAFCAKEFKAAELPPHEDECGRRRATCGECGAATTVRDAAAHAAACEPKTVHCECRHACLYRDLAA